MYRESKAPMASVDWRAWGYVRRVTGLRRSGFPVIEPSHPPASAQAVWVRERHRRTSGLGFSRVLEVAIDLRVVLGRRHLGATGRQRAPGEPLGLDLGEPPGQER